MFTCSIVRFTLVVLCLAASDLAHGAKATVAVATNFSEVAKQLVAHFEIDVSNTGADHQLRLVSGSTGKLFAQIINQAPFDLFLAADAATPSMLAERGFAVDESQFTYAMGRLVLWSADPKLLGADGEVVLRQGMFRALAIANPRLAPYGLAARQTLEALGLWQRLAPRIVRGENVGQAHTLVATGNAELGFIARSLLATGPWAEPGTGSRWAVPARLHEPIRQDAVLTARGQKNAAALAFITYLHGPEARRIIVSFGYAVALP